MFVYYQFLVASSRTTNNKIIVIENRQKIFQLQLQLSTFENFQLQLRLLQNRVINYNFVNCIYNFSKPDVKCRERKCREIFESKLEDGQCGFRPGRSTADQIFTLKQTFEKSWEYGKDLFARFVDREKAYDRVSRNKLCKVLREYDVDGQL